MTDRPDDNTHQRYREAAEIADERPSAATRAAILAAAAREVAARPRDVSKPGPVGSRRLGRAPMAAAAAVLLSTLAVMLAQRTEQEMPQLDAPASAPAAQAPVPSTALATAPAAEEQEARKLKQEMKHESVGESPQTRVQSFNEAPAKPVAREVPKRIETEPESRLAKESAPAEAAADTAAGARQAKEADAASAESARTAAPVPAAKAVSPPSVAAPAPASPAAEPAPAPDGRMLGAASGALRKDERQRATRDQAATPSAALEAKPDTDASAWLERIIALRAKGDDVEADAELKRFRERFPEVVIPPQALARPGTR